MVKTDIQDYLEEVVSLREGLYFKAKMQLNLPVSLHSVLWGVLVGWVVVVVFVWGFFCFVFCAEENI